ncbi:uncharacterized protein [Amphiura filiformis]|uniref:uncharacterized protein isoform X2 n=1 Tax=Amphiura filiformis TaxID=82378 RepID=UPI003B22547A
MVKLFTVTVVIFFSVFAVVSDHIVNAHSDDLIFIADLNGNSLHSGPINSPDDITEIILSDADGPYTPPRPVAIEYDPLSGKVYWTDVVEKTINRANRDGSGKEMILSGLSVPDGIAIDTVNRWLYWTDTGTDEIKRSNLDGTLPTVIIEDNLVEPRAIVVDYISSHLYWTDWGESPSKIERSTTSGMARTTLVDTGLVWPNGITLDFSDERLYWCDANLNRIESTDLLGQNRVMLYQSTVDIHPYDIGVFGSHVYWSDWSFSVLIRLHKYIEGGQPESIGPQVFLRAGGLHIYQNNPEDSRCISACCSGGLLNVQPAVGSMLGGDMIKVSTDQICGTPPTTIWCRFAGNAVEGSVANNEGMCVTPTMFVNGRIELEISFVDPPVYNFQGFFTLVSVDQIPPPVTRVDAETWETTSDSFTLSWDPAFRADQFTTVAVDLYGYTEDTSPSLTKIFTVTVSDLRPSSVINPSPASVSYNLGEITFFKSNFLLAPYHTGIFKVYDDQALSSSNAAAIWSDVHSLQWIFPRSSTWCNSWASDERGLPELNNMEEGITTPVCPCTFAQAVLDFARYSPHPECNLETATDCSLSRPGAMHCVRAIRPSEGAGQECCYGSDGEILNVNTGDAGGGFSSRHHYAGIPSYGTQGTVPFLSYFVTDYEPWLQCCRFYPGTDGANCNLYKDLRPSQSCGGYTALATGVGWGDPHILTLDRTPYTFNGRGEYLMIDAAAASGSNTDRFRLQARTSLLQDSDFPVTVFVAMVAQYGSSDIIQVELSERHHLDVWVKEAGQEWRLLDLTESAWWVLNGASVYGQNLIENGVLVLFTGGVSLQFKATTGINRVMSVLFFGPDTFKETTMGLLGTWNDNPDDDFTTPDRLVLPASASTDDIHYQFGQLWQIQDASDSLFYYHPLTSYDTFRDDAFTPVFTAPDNDNVPDEVLQMCDGNEWCVFDSLATGDIAVGLASKATFEEQEAIFEASMNVINCGVLNSPTNGRVVVSRANVGGVAYYSCNDGYMVMGLDRRVCQGNGQWFGMAPSCQLIPEIGPSSFIMGNSVYTVLESDRSLVFTIQRSGDVQTDGSIKLSVTAGTASSSTDFDPYEEQVQFQAGIRTIQRTVNIINDDILEDLESFEIRLSEPSNSELGMPDMATAFIEDDEVEHFFKEIAFSVPENSQRVRLTVLKRGRLTRTTVDFATTPDSAKSPDDYYQRTGSLAFEEDENMRFIDVTLHDDNVFETSEQFSISLRSNIAGQIGSRDTAIINIENDDELCSIPCENGGSCTDVNTCTCTSPAFYGTYCEKDSCIPPCENGGKCTAFSECDCLEGYRGSRCEIPICVPECLNGGACIDANTCTCPFGFTGRICDTPVCSPPCLNGGTCDDLNICTCPFKFTGSRCEKQATDDCLTVGICGGPEFRCIETPESYECACAIGYYQSGESCVLAPRVVIAEISVLEINGIPLVFGNSLYFQGTREYMELENVVMPALSEILLGALPGYLGINIRRARPGSVIVEFEVLLDGISNSGTTDVLRILQERTSFTGMLIGVSVDIKINPSATMIITELCPVNYCSENMECVPVSENLLSICQCVGLFEDGLCVQSDDVIKEEEKEFSAISVVFIGISLIIIMLGLGVGFCICYRLRIARNRLFMQQRQGYRHTQTFASPVYDLSNGSPFHSTGAFNQNMQDLSYYSAFNTNSRSWGNPSF